MVFPRLVCLFFSPRSILPSWASLTSTTLKRKVPKPVSLLFCNCMLSQSLSAVEIPRPQPMKVTSETIYSQACTSQMRQGGACRVFIFRYATSSEARFGLLQCLKTGKKTKSRTNIVRDLYIQDSRLLYYLVREIKTWLHVYFIISSEKYIEIQPPLQNF